MKQPDDDTGYYCCECKKPCDVIWTDEGIGQYEYCGARGVHVDWQATSKCCDALVTDQEIEDDQDLPDEA